jgi:uncharacterized membrane protein (UPF0182 family)
MMLSLFRSRLSFWLITTVVVVGFFLLLNLPDLVVEWLWMENLGHESVFWTIRLTQAGLFGSAFVAVLAFVGTNAYALSRYLSTHRATYSREGVQTLDIGEVQMPLDRVNGFIAAGTAVLSLFFATIFLVRWDTFLRFSNGQPFGQPDPVFGYDIGFYIFSLPFLELLQNNLASLAFLVAAALILIYAYTGGFTYYREANRLRIHPHVLKHVSINVIVLLAAWAWGYYLNRYGLLTDSGGLVYGAGYIDIVVKHPALWVMVAATIGLMVLVGINLRRNQPGLLVAGFGAYFAVHVIGLMLLPTAVQRLNVEPNELEVERPYIENNISMTRQAYRLDGIEEPSYTPSNQLTRQDVVRAEQTMENVRLWDSRLLIQTYRQLQDIRLYYEFYNVDVDRYTVEGDYRQVMLSARELSGRLPRRSDSWVNRHLQFTHGYGLTMNYVSEEGVEGVPELLVKDLPPTSAEGLEVDEAAIYYGEEMPYYKIVNTDVQELDYPRGDDNVYTHYRGTGGVQLDSYWKKLLFAYHQSDFNIVLSDYLNEDTRIQFWVQIRERLQRVAPFLEIDPDPYLVLANGRLFWIMDAYTTSTQFPYSDPDRQRNLNYIRNSVKVVIDAYNGDVDLYSINEDEDPVLQMYQQVFPELFQPIDELPDELRSHLRYPEEIFNIQLDKFNRYHMTRPQVFYNNEDLWTRPREMYAGSEQTMMPYYLLMQLPTEQRTQFLLLSPLTPDNRDNMIAWMAAKSDPPNYGDLVVYNLPKERLVYGPSQVEARIDQNTEISRQLTLWDQRGSRAIRGNLLAIPIGQTFLYVEPVFLVSQGLELPQLKRVIVSHGERTVMAPTFEEALLQIIGSSDQPLPVVQPVTDTTGTRQTRPVTSGFAESALDRLDQVEQALREGQWAEFGEELEQLKQLLDNPEEWQSLEE